MKKCSLHLIVTAMTVFALLVVMTAPAAAQGRGAQSRKPKPTVGAWWYKGDPQPPGPHPDLTGVWFGGPMNDIGRDLLPGQQLVLTLYGAERYKKNRPCQGSQRPVPAARSHKNGRPGPSDHDRPTSGRCGRAERVRAYLSIDLHRWPHPSLSRDGQSGLVWVFGRYMGRRHARRRHGAR